MGLPRDENSYQNPQGRATEESEPDEAKRYSVRLEEPTSKPINSIRLETAGRDGVGGIPSRGTPAVEA